MNPSHSDSPVKPQLADAQAPASPQTNDLNSPTSEALLRLKAAAMEAAMDGIALLENGRYIYLNSQHFRIFGYDDAEQLMGQPWTVLYEPEEAERLQREVFPILESAGNWRGEAIAKRKDGSTFVEELSLTFTEDQILICVCRDISTRKQAEQERTLLQEQLRSRSKVILEAQQEASLDGFLIIDENRQVVSYNQKFCQLWQIPQSLIQRGKDQELLAHVLDQLAFPQEVIDQVEYVYQHLEIIIEDEVRLKDGRIFERYGAPLRSPSGDYYGRIWSFRDITERRSMEEQLRVSQQRLSLLVQQTPLAVIEWNTQLEVTAWNPSAERIFGYSASEAIGRNLDFLVPEFEQKKVSDAVANLLIQKTGTQIVNQNLTKDGRLIICQWYNTPLVAGEGELMGVASMATDITEQKRIESELQRSQAQLQAILDNTPVAIYVKDLVGRYTLINRAVENMFQIKQADWLGKTDQELMPTEVAESIQYNDLEVIAQGQPIHLEETVICGGEELHFVAVKFPLFNEKKKPYALCGISTDITSLKRAEEQLKTQTAFLQSIWDHINYGIYVLDVIDDGKDFRFLSLNPATVNISPVPIHSLVGRRLSEVFSEEITNIFFPYYRQVVRSGESISFEERFVIGKELWWFLTLAPLKDAQGKVYQIVVTAADIAERKRTEEKLRLQQNQIKYLLNNIPHMAWLKNSQGQFIAANQPLSERLGLTPEEMIGLRDSELFNVEFARIVLQDDLQVMTSKQRQRFEKKIVDPEGKTIWLEIYKTPIIGDQNNVLGTVGIGIEITERKQAEHYLKKQARREKLLNQLTAQIRKSLDFDTILQATLNSIRDYLAADRCGFSLYYPHSEQPYWEVIQESHHQELPSFKGNVFFADVIGPITELALKGETIRIVDVEEEANPSLREVLRATKTQSMVSIPLQRSSGQIGLLTCSMHRNHIRNWTDEEVALLRAVVEQLAIALKQAELYEQTRTKAQELEAAMGELRQTQAKMIQNEKMSSLGQLVAGIAHEINNPASFIYGNLIHARDYTSDLLNLIEIYQTHYPDPPPEIETELAAIDLDFVMEDLPKLINSMQTGAERIKKFVESLRTFSRLDEAELKIIDLHQGIESTLRILQSRLHQKNRPSEIEVIREYGDLPKLECYAGQLNQVFLNLLTNAIDALEEAMEKPRETGKTFADPRIRIRTEVTPDNQVAIAIADNGFGIPPEIQTRIFDPFFTTKPVGKGTGMGLSICYQIITEKHGGSIDCISGAEGGAEFIIRIPISGKHNG